MRYKNLFLTIALLILAGTSSAGTTLAQQAEPGPAAQPIYAPGQLVVKFKPDAANLIQTQLAGQPGDALKLSSLPGLDELNRRYKLSGAAPIFDATVNVAAQSNGLANIYLLTVPESTDIWQMAADYAASDQVVYAEPNYISGLPNIVSALDAPITPSDIPAIFPDDPDFTEQYNLYNTGQTGGTPGADVNAPDAWQIQTGDPAVMIAILDTGVNYNHPDLVAKVRTDIDYDFVGQDDQALDSADHGTRVAGVAAASSNNGLGISGMCWGCQILPVRVGTSVVHFSDVSVAQGLVYATDMGADVINMSLGGQCSNLWADAVNYAYEHNVVLVAAAGNLVESVVYPALFKRVIAVSATDQNDHFAWFSSYGPAVDVAAPGDNVPVTTMNGGIGLGSGTSYATALVSGLAGLLRSENPALTNAQIRQILRDTAKDLGPTGFDGRFGYGRVNAAQALSQAFTPPAVVYDPGPDSCGCLLTQTTGQTSVSSNTTGVSAAEQLLLLYQLRDDVLAATPLGQRITQDYYRHSPQVTALLLQNTNLRNRVVSLFNATVPYLVSLLQEDGQKPLDGALIGEAGSVVQELANEANPELRTDLLQTWQTLNLNQYAGQPVKNTLAALNQQAGTKIYLPIIIK